MFARLGHLVARHWIAVIAVWIAIGVGAHLVAPSWDSVTNDGDLAYLPDRMTTVRGERLLAQAFPDQKSKSQIVLVAARNEGPLTDRDRQMLDDNVARSAIIELQAIKLVAVACQAEPLAQGTEKKKQLMTLARKQLEQIGRAEISTLPNERIAALAEAILIQANFVLTSEKRETIARNALPILVGVWTPNSDVIGSKLISPNRQAALVVLQLTNEFMSIENMELIKQVDTVLKEAQQRPDFPSGLELGLSGSAAVGGDMLDSAAESIKNTEIITFLLVVGILALVYRAPVLVLIPLMTLGISVFVATDLLSLLTQVKYQPGLEWFDFKVFKTSKIFIVTILFGSGTDFCLFLISRYREELERGHTRKEALAVALGQVGDAITASAATTVFGLSMMFFADFGKYRNSGPAIGLCLGVALVACLTLAPALLRAFAWVVFWPGGVKQRTIAADGSLELTTAERNSWTHRFWEWIGQAVITRPGLILVGSVLLLAPLAWTGYHTQVTYNLLAEMSPNRPSVRGTEMLARHFPAGEMGPITVLAHKPGAQFNTKEGEQEIARLTKWFYSIDGVQSVRSITEPLGDQPGLSNPFSSAGRNKMLARKHPHTRATYLTSAPLLAGDVTRFDILLKHDPFSLEALATLEQIDTALQPLNLEQARQRHDGWQTSLAAMWNTFAPTSQPRAAVEPLPEEIVRAWSGVEFDFLGTTAATRDLKETTQSDQLLIQLLVTFSVLGILIVLLKQPLVCLYLIVSVLFSYLVTLGATELIFSAAYPTFHGLDWKVPIFLFVILVAVGEDYNIYLLTRVVEEQKRHGLMEGLRIAVVRTGGIITSCGVIMAGTFVSMMGGSLRGMSELGFALTLGVMLDTIIVRPILVPAFLAILYRRREPQAPSTTPVAANMTSSVNDTLPWPPATPHAPASLRTSHRIRTNG